MKTVKIAFFLIVFFLISLSFSSLVFANQDVKLAQVVQKREAHQVAREYVKDIRQKKSQARKVAREYVKDLRQRIAEERYEEIPPIGERLSLRQAGSLKTEIAYRISEPQKFTKIKEQLLLSETGRFSDNLRFKISGRLYYDAVYSLTDTFGENVASDQEMEMELRDTYLDYSSGPFDLRLGKQQIVWGEALALFFADVVNARDLREFILPDFEIIRIPQWGADVEYSKENFHAELVWMPILEFDKVGVTGSEFFFPYPLPTSTTTYTTVDPSEPADNFNNSNVGLRLSYLFKNGLDLSTFYYYGWTKSPVLYRSIVSDVYNFLPKYQRLNTYGLTLAKEFKGAVFKGEFVLSKDDFFPIFDTTDPDGIVERSFLNYLLGVDYTFFERLETTVQFMQKVIFNYSDLLINEDRIDNSLALRIKTDFWEGRLEPELLIITSLSEEDLLYRPKINYRINDNLSIRLGADIFQGKLTGTFGKFDKKSRLYSEFKYSF